MEPVELIGYLASALVIISLTRRSVVKLRMISLAGSITFVTYGVLIGAVPIAISNVVIAGINVWFLRAELGGHRDLGASPIDPTAPFLADFLAFHRADIEQTQPGFVMPAVDDDPFVLLLLRDGLPAGALVGRRHGRELEVVLDYVTPPYRDSRLGQWLFGPGRRVFRSHGITRLTSSPGATIHPPYLERMGFRLDDDRYVLELT